MSTLTIYAAVLLVAALLSDLARRSFFSTAVLFLGAGFVFGDGVLGLVDVDPRQTVASRVAELALFAVLYVDGMRIDRTELAEEQRPLARALLLGMPIAVVLMAAMARALAGLSWLHSFLFAAALSPTDPVFASAIVGREEVPFGLRRLLNVESGLNDGLALPLVVVLLSLAVGHDVELGELAAELALGVAIGVFVPGLTIELCKRSRLFATSPRYAPLEALAFGMLVLGLTSLANANEFLAAFSAGVTVASRKKELKESFRDFGEALAELLKLAAVFVFGAMARPRGLTEIGVAGWALAVSCIVAARPLSIAIAFYGSALEGRQRIAAAWFGPKGFASVFFSLLILKSGAPHADRLFHLIAAVIALSIVVHSSTDVVLSRWLVRKS